MKLPEPRGDTMGFTLACLEVLRAAKAKGERLMPEVQPLLQKLADMERTEAPLAAVAWRSARFMVEGMTLALDAPPVEAAALSEDQVDEALNAARRLAMTDLKKARVAFAAVAAEIIAGAGSDFVDMGPPHDGDDEVSAWLSGAMLARRGA